MDRATFFRHFDELADQPDALTKMRELVLELAVRGQIVEHDTTEESVSELLRRIETERKKIRASGESRIPNEFEEVEASEHPWHTPKHWAWRRLAELVLFIDYRGKTPVKTNNGVRLLTAKNIRKGYISIRPEEFIAEDSYQQWMTRGIPQIGDVLFTTEAPLGNAAVLELKERVALAQRTINFRPFADYDPKFMVLCICSRPYQELLINHATGMTATGIKSAKLKYLPFPVPPLDEQRRIVSKVHDLISLCDELAAQQQAQHDAAAQFQRSALHHLTIHGNQTTIITRWQRVSDHFHWLHDSPDSITQIRQAILHLAVQGRLIPQNPKDEPAEKLLARLRAKHCPKGLAVADHSNGNSKPFDLPRGWTWGRFPELGKFSRGKSRHRPRNEPSLYSDGKYPLVQTGDVARAKGIIRTHTGLYNEKGLAQSKLWPEGTMCITIAANIAETGILGIEACIPDSVVGFIPDPEFNGAEYFEFFMRTAKAHLQDFAPSTAQKNINMGILESVYIPLPPLAEQKRIVAQVEDLMKQCDDLEAQLTQAQNIGANLLKSTIHHLLATGKADQALATTSRRSNG
jgi:type I restriction enzyme S subunit